MVTFRRTLFVTKASVFALHYISAHQLMSLVNQKRTSSNGARDRKRTLTPDLFVQQEKKIPPFFHAVHVIREVGQPIAKNTCKRKSVGVKSRLGSCIWRTEMKDTQSEAHLKTHSALCFLVYFLIVHT